jgi:predicted nucleic acid-binding protein
MFFERDKFYSEGREIFFKIIMKEIEPVVPNFAIAEVCGAVRRFTNNLHLAMIVEDILNTWVDSNILDAKDFTADRMKLTTETAIRFSLKGGDAVFVSLAKELGIAFLTFDEEIKKKIKGKIKLYD